MERKNLFQPITIGKHEIKNRLAMTPMCLNYNLKGGLVSERTKAFYCGRAKDGLGLIIAGTLTASNVVRIRRVESGFVMMDHTAKPGLFELAETAHRYGCKIFMQFSAGMGRQVSTRDQWPDPTADPIAASPVASITCLANIARLPDLLSVMMPLMPFPSITAPTAEQ